MLLFEEYLARNQLDVPYAKHAVHQAVFYRRGGDHWAILLIRFNEQGNHPGYYSVRYMEPVGNRTGVTMRRWRDDEVVYWENYQTFLTDWAKGVRKSDIAHNELEARLAAWEMCLFVFDSLLVSYANSPTFFNTINLDLTPADRYRNIERMIGLIAKDERGKARDALIRFWEDDLASFYGNYAIWLVKLVERYGC